MCLSGCLDLFDVKDKYYPLEDKYKIKFNAGDTLTYYNQQGTSFQLVIDEIKYDKRTVSRKGSSGPYNIIERQTVFYDSVNTNPVSYLPIRNIYTVQPDGHVIWEPYLYERTGLFHERITLNSKNYYSVFQFSATTSSNKIIKWYYSFQNGFVGFELSNGQIYTLDIPWLQ